MDSTREEVLQEMKFTIDSAVTLLIISLHTRNLRTAHKYSLSKKSHRLNLDDSRLKI